jgi:dextranase
MTRMTVQLLPTLTSYRPDRQVEIEVRGFAGAGTLSVWRLGQPVSEHHVNGAGTVGLGLLAAGGYGIELGDGDRVLARTAVEVVADPRSVLRYGFVVDYRPDRDISAVQDNLRRLHLTGVQFYDWAYRHADLLGGGEQYDDALGQPVALATVRRLIQACHEVGSDALGYAAVYAVGPNEWPKWEHDALLTATGQPYALGDFLFVLDPAAPDWLAHFGADLAAAVAEVGFDGFHLDQYGYPKRAHRPDGVRVDVAASFQTMIAGVRGTLPESRLVFNNVNDFPTWATGSSPQDAVYIEVWPPHEGLEHLAQVATRARAEAGGKPVVIAAYQHVYDSAEADSADLATAFTMATLWSHGVTHLLCGEADRILVDPYYVRNHQVSAATADLLRRWYDFAVEHADLLHQPGGCGPVEVTGSYAGSYNDDLDISYAGVEVGHHARPGTVWRRVMSVGDGGDRLALHLINLRDQQDTRWDAPRLPPTDLGPGTLRIRRVGTGLPRVRYADPDHQPRLIDVGVHADGDFAVAVLPSPRVWQLVLIDPESEPARVDPTTVDPT